MTRPALDVSLFDEQQDEHPPTISHLEVARVTTADVDEFARRYHYTGSGGNALWRWGLWHGVTLYGVIAYNLPTRAVCESVFGPDKFDRVWHMGRLALAEKAPYNAESKLIGGSLRAIRREHPEIWAVVTYADQQVGHLGLVYQATNAIYTGEGGDPVWYRDRDGNRHGTYLSGHVNAARAASLGWTRGDGAAVKHRYVYVLGTPKQRRARLAELRLPSLPYPKDGG